MNNSNQIYINRQTLQSHNAAMAEHSSAGQLSIILRSLGDSTMEPIVVMGSEFTVGRKLAPFDAQIVTRAAQLSRQHARVFKKNGQAFVEDLGSLNGTYLNHQKVGPEPLVLASGDELHFSSEFQFAVELIEQPADDQTVLESPAPIELQLIPPAQSQLKPLLITRFPYLFSRNSDIFKTLKQQQPEAMQQLSRKHALISLVGEQLFIEDLQSANGTFLTGTRIKQSPLPMHDGDELCLGKELFQYKVQVRNLDDDRTIMAEPIAAVAGVDPVFGNNPVWPLNFLHLIERGAIAPGHQYDKRAMEFRRIKRQLLANLQLEQSESNRRPGNLIFVTSSLAGEGKSMVSLNLALSLANEKDHRVLLVDSYPASDGLSATLGLADRPGLIEALTSEKIDLGAYVRPTNIEHLSILPSGQRVPNLGELLASRRTAKQLLELANRNPNLVIIFDGPPLLPTTEAQILAHIMGQTILVVEADNTPRQSVEQSVAQLKDCRCVSLLLNKASAAAE